MSVIDVIGLLLVGATVGYLVGRNASAGEETQRELRWIHVVVSTSHILQFTEKLLKYNDDLLSKFTDSPNTAARRDAQEERSIIVAQKRLLQHMQVVLLGKTPLAAKAEKKI